MSTLLEQIQALDPALVASRDDVAIAAALSVGRVKVVPLMLSARGLASSIAGGPLAAEVILMKLEGARDTMLASADPDQQVLGSLLRRQLTFLAGDGLDFGAPALRGMIAQFGTLGILTADDVAALLALGVVPDPVTPTEVYVAIRNEDGSFK